MKRGNRKVAALAACTFFILELLATLIAIVGYSVPKEYWMIVLVGTVVVLVNIVAACLLGWGLKDDD